MKNLIFPCLWFDGKAKEAATLYCSLFNNSSITTETEMVVNFKLNGQLFMGLNGGPQFKPTASISFFVTFENDHELERAWKGLADGGFVFMPLDKYDWSEKYGWVQDQFGISWQLSLGNIREIGQKLVPLLMFCGDYQGMAKDAIDHYVSIFDQSKVDMIATYKPEQVTLDATIVHARFYLGNNLLMAMDSNVPQPFTFNEGISLVVDCKTQEEIDHYWSKLSEGGEESMCGWLKDKFGVSWQIVPTVLHELMSDAQKAPKVMQAFMQMRKFDIEGLLRATKA
ncbi:VOC family protein [Olivibacter sp. SDN3]|uniref:VOC family protein n=1 Tax=Olivibacter sp. SDN3 TaxID=2764720 RepID=UPI0016516EFF|nr:VOC family protein [Olivibacter sp. SDN3]QNL49227.1 VOC family protein [Olivibacter sp. SDN3]